MKKSTTQFILAILGIIMCMVATIPSVTHAEPPAPPSPSGYTGIVPDCEGPTCDFNGLLQAIKKVINVGTIFALSFSVVVIAVAGGKYLISGDKPGERAKANEMLVKVGWGIVFILGAWLIVSLITSTLLKDPSIVPFG